MSNRFTYILRGKFLTQNASKKWVFMVYLLVLGCLMIAASHNADKKVFAISKVNSDIKSLKSQYVEITSKVQSLKLKSNLVKKLQNRGINYPNKPLKRIVVKVNKDYFHEK